MAAPSIHRHPSVPRDLTPLAHALGVIAITAAALVSCAKPQTLVLTEVSTDATVPPLLILQYSVVRVANPGRPITEAVVSQSPGDAADGRAPFLFPMILPVGPLAGWSGAVEITLYGRDYFSNKIVASGKTTAVVIPNGNAQATLALTAASDPADADGGTDSNAGDSAAGDAASDTPSGS